MEWCRRRGWAGELADGREGNAWELGFPCPCEVGPLLTGNGDEEFVVLAIRKCLLWRAALVPWKFRWVDAEAALGSPGESREIAGETVAQVHHGGRTEMTDEPAGMVESGNEVEVMAGEGASEASGDGEGIAGPAARAEREAMRFDRAEQGDREDGLLPLWKTRRFAAGDAGSAASRGFGDPLVELGQPCEWQVRGQGQRDEGLVGDPAHGGDIADGAVEEFGSDAAGVGFHGEVDPGDEAVGFEEGEGGIVRAAEDSAVVAWTGVGAAGLRKVSGEEGDDAVFAGCGERPS